MRAFLFLLVLAAPVPTPQAPAPLAQSDFALGRLVEGVDSSTVRRQLGKPHSIIPEDPVGMAGETHVMWRYSRVTVDFVADHVIALSATDSTFSTPRGLRVGDSVRRVTRLYGQPADRWEDSFSHEDHLEYDHSGRNGHQLMVTIRGGRVAEIFAGQVITQ